jgi:hypothetical protein
MLHGALKKAAEYVTGPLSKSQFEEKRVRRGLEVPHRATCIGERLDERSRCPQVLTPDEFVLAGDYLTRLCPTWSWYVDSAVRSSRSTHPSLARGHT